MSTRYVWGKYNVISKYVTATERGGTDFAISGGGEYYYLGTGYSLDENTGVISLTGASRVHKGTSWNAESLPYACFSGSSTGTTIHYSGGSGRWVESDTNGFDVSLENSSGSDKKHATEIYSRLTTEKGSLVGDISSANSGTYPQNGVQGSNWYTYQGQDNIDPSAVSIPAAIAPGQQITITVTPGSGKVYGGTVSYQYQVKLDSGEWQTVATTTATTQTYTVPAGAQNIQVRVRAQDDLGFTSGTYVESAAVTVVGAPSSITVPGAAMTGQSIQVSWSAVDTGGES